MNKLPFNPVLNRIFNYCLIPTLLSVANSKASPERDYLQDALSDIDYIKSHMKPYEERIKRYYLSSNTSYLVLEFFDERIDFTSFDEFLAYLRSLSDKQILTRIISVFEFFSLTEANAIPDTHYELHYLFQLIDQHVTSNEEKWYWISAVHQPHEFIEQLAQLLEELVPWFEPIYNQWEAECLQAYEPFDLNDFVKRYDSFVSTDILSTLSRDDYQLITLMPLMTYFIMMGNPLTRGKSSPVLLLLGTRIPQIFDATFHDLTNDSRTELLKHLSDATRYQILQMSATSNYKAKDIAEKLSITPAAVSYHTSKLTTSGLLTFTTTEDNAIQQQLNKTLLQQLFDKIKNDFNIE